MGHSCIEVVGDRLLTCIWNDFNVFPPDCTPPLPVFLTSFEVEPHDGAVEVTWAVAGDEPSEFRLRGQQDGAAWPVAFAARPGGMYRARDSAPRLATGGVVTYTLEHRKLGDDRWAQVGSLTVALTGPRHPVTLLDPGRNPFNPVIVVGFVLDAPQRARFAIYDLAGRQISELAAGTFRSRCAPSYLRTHAPSREASRSARDAVRGSARDSAHGSARRPRSRPPPQTQARPQRRERSCLPQRNACRIISLPAP